MDKENINKIRTANAAVRYVVLSALTFLSALILRDFITSTWKRIERKVRKKKEDDDTSSTSSTWVSSLLFSIVVVSVTLITAVFWKGSPGAFALN
jgi:hypothetical protein